MYCITAVASPSVRRYESTTAGAAAGAVSKCKCQFACCFKYCRPSVSPSVTIPTRMRPAQAQVCRCQSRKGSLRLFASLGNLGEPRRQRRVVVVLRVALDVFHERVTAEKAATQPAHAANAHECEQASKENTEREGEARRRVSQSEEHAAHVGVAGFVLPVDVRVRRVRAQAGAVDRAVRPEPRACARARAGRTCSARAGVRVRRSRVCARRGHVPSRSSLAFAM